MGLNYLFNLDGDQNQVRGVGSMVTSEEIYRMVNLLIIPILSLMKMFNLGNHGVRLIET